MQALTRVDVAGRNYIVYEFELTLYGESWTVRRRFIEFHDLHEKLKLGHPIVMGALTFPPKNMWPTEKFLRERHAGLEVFSFQVFVTLFSFALNSTVYFF